MRILKVTQAYYPFLDRGFSEATQKIAGYREEYTFERTAHVGMGRVPVIIGLRLRSLLDARLPGWEEALNWTLVAERASLPVTLLVCCSLAGRLGLSGDGGRRLGLTRVRLREQLLRAGATLFSSPQ